MNVKPVFQKPDQSAQRASRSDSDQDDQRLGDPGRKILDVPHKDRGQESGEEHLTGDSDVKQPRLKSNNERQRCQHHRRQDVQVIKKIRQHAAPAAVLCLRQKTAALQEAPERDHRILPHQEQNHTGCDQHQDDRQDRNRQVAPPVAGEEDGKPRFLLFFHASLTPII